MFALISLDSTPLRITLKSDPEEAVVLRERYSSITPGYHMNKKLWNTVVLDGSLQEAFITNLIDQSYRLIVESLPKKIQK